jgi:hypothetical protein
MASTGPTSQQLIARAIRWPTSLCVRRLVIVATFPLCRVAAGAPADTARPGLRAHMPRQAAVGQSKAHVCDPASAAVSRPGPSQQAR